MISIWLLFLATKIWEQRKLGEIGTTYSGLSGKNKSDFEKGNSNFVTFLEVLNNPVLKNIDLTNKVEIKENEHQNKVKRNDILFNTSSETPEEVATSTVVDVNQDNLYLNSFCFGFRPNVQFSNYYIGYYLRSNHFRSRVFCLAQGISRYNISKKSLIKLKLSLPKLEEQDKISRIFNQIELLLTLYERKLKLLSQVKKYFLDNLFAKKEYPNLRFKGYEDTWLKSKFSKFLSIPEKVKVTIDSPSRILTVKLNLGGVQKGANRTTLKLNSTTYYLRKAGQLIYGKQNLFNGSLAIIPSQFEGYVTSGDVPSLNINNIDKRFLYYYIARKSFYKKTEAYSSGTGSKRIHEKTFLGFNIVYPEDLKEQEKISKLISSINSNIELYRSKKNNLMAIKKNLLNAMFI